MYYPSNVFHDVSHDENRNPQDQPSGAQIPKDIKVILHQSTSPPQYQPCVCKPPSPRIPISFVSLAMEWRSPPVPSDRGHKIRTTIDKGPKVRRLLIPLVIVPPDSVSPVNLSKTIWNLPRWPIQRLSYRQGLPPPAVG